jgi:hypothetical protein
MQMWALLTTLSQLRCRRGPTTSLLRPRLLRQYGRLQTHRQLCSVR